MNLTRHTGGKAVAIVSVLALVSTGCGQETVPPALLGRWTTTDSRYEGRAFELTGSDLSIIAAPLESSRHEIRGVDTEMLDGGQVRLTIDYDSDGSRRQFVISYDRPGPDGVPGWVHLANQPDFEWTRSQTQP